MTSVDDVVLPGAAARLRAGRGVTGPQDVPRWMTHGGASARSAAARLAAEAAVVRRAGELLGTVLVDATGALGWRGAAATAGSGRGRGLSGHLALAAGGLEEAQAALHGLATVLDGQAATLRPAPLLSAPGRWDPLPPDRKASLLGRWGPAVAVVDTADARAATALDAAATTLTRVRVAVGREGWPAAAGPPSAATSPQVGGSTGPSVARSVGEVCAGLVTGLEALAVAVGEHPEAVVELGAGAWLTGAGVAGEFGGLALDSTGVGAAAGVPVGVVSAGAIATGAGLMAMGAGTLGGAAHEQTAARSSGAGGGAGGGSPGGSGRIDVEKTTYAQRWVSERFSSQGSFKGRLLDAVVADLRSGRLRPDDVTVQVVERDGNWLILNTRSAKVLERAGVPKSEWAWKNMTGDPLAEKRLSRQLARNGLDSSGVRTVDTKGS